MLLAVLIGAYVVAGLVTFVLSIGWQYADSEGHFRFLNDKRGHAAFAFGWSIGIALLWPIGLPISYITSGFAEYGWVWPFPLPPRKDR